MLKGGGVCNFQNNSTGTCVCYEKWADSDCSHERKKQSTAFGLSWLFLLGMPGCGRIYLGHPSGIAELVLGVISILVFSVPVLIWSRCHSRVFADTFGKTTRFPVLCNCDDAFTTTFCSFIMYPLAIGMTTWGFVDLILIGTGQLDDNDGYSMYKNLF